MILVDTSVWIDYFRGSPACQELGALLEGAEIVVHPFVHGEIALGHLGRRRDQILRDIATLPGVDVVPDADVLYLVEAQRLGGTGIGWVDAHLLAAALHARVVLWTLDRSLSRIASRLRVSR